MLGFLFGHVRPLLSVTRESWVLLLPTHLLGNIYNLNFSSWIKNHPSLVY